jgi:hypothetical protein
MECIAAPDRLETRPEHVTVTGVRRLNSRVSVGEAGREERQGPCMSFGIVDVSSKRQSGITSAAKLLRKSSVIRVEHAGVMIPEDCISCDDVFSRRGAPVH